VSAEREGEGGVGGGGGRGRWGGWGGGGGGGEDRRTGTFGLLLTLIHGIAIYLVDSVIHPSKNWGLVCKIVGHHFIAARVRGLGGHDLF